MRALFLLTLVSLTALADDSPGRFHRFCDRTAQGRTSRGLQCDDLAFFEAFPASGAGTFGACSTTAPTGARGEAMTFTRASGATCTRTASGGLVTSGIANGDLIELTNNQARVAFDSGGVLGLLVESQGINLLLQFIALANAVWADVGTPALTGSQVSPFSGTHANSAVLVDDNDGAAFEGRSQTITVTAGVAHTMHCYVKAGTLASARIVLDGTAATKSGLSATTWDIIEVTDASSSGVAIVAEVDNGAAASDTGTVIWGGCDVKTGTYRTSIVPTLATTATRAVESAGFAGTAVVGLTVSTGSSALTVSTLWGGSIPSTRTFLQQTGVAEGRSAYADLFNRVRAFDGTTELFFTTTFTPGAPKRIFTYWSAALTPQFLVRDSTAGVQDSANFDGSWGGAGSLLQVGGGGTADAIISRICYDPDPSRCR